MYRYGINLLMKQWPHYCMTIFVTSVEQSVQIWYQLTHEIVASLEYDCLVSSMEQSVQIWYQLTHEIEFHYSMTIFVSSTEQCAEIW